MDFAAKFEQGHAYADFLDAYGTAEHRRRWDEVYQRVQLSDAQRELLGGFQRQMKVLVTAGTWCGDCVEQCPIFQRFTEASEKIQIRYFDRDAHEDLKQELSICGGARVPMLVFLSEEGAECGRYGDRTLSKYRDKSVKELGAACPSGVTAPEQSLLDAVTQDWLDEFERIQLMLCTSPRLRKKHGD